MHHIYYIKIDSNLIEFFNPRIGFCETISLTNLFAECSLDFDDFELVEFFDSESFYGACALADACHENFGDAS